MQIKTKYLLFGIAFGLVFPIAAILIDCCLFNDGSFAFSEIKSYFSRNPIHYLVATAPIFLGIAFFIAGINAQKQHETVKKLKKVNENLQDTNEALDSFNYHVSHDLKTVLTNTESLAIMLRKYVAKENLQKVSNITDRLLKISLNGQDTVKSFLAFSKATSIEFDKNQKGIDLKYEIEEIRDTHFKDEVLKVTVDDIDFRTLKIDRKALESVMINLFTNSIKYNKNKVAVVNITLQNLNGFHEIVYTDNGIGIDTEANKDKLFKPFEKIHTDNETEGTGVGLYLIQKIVGAYGGHVSLNSELGNGATFTLAIPKT